MSFSNQNVYPQAFSSTVTQFTSSTGTTATQILAQPTNGYQVRGVLVSNSDTVAHDVILSLYRGSTAYQVAQISVPAGAGFSDSVPAVDLFQAVAAGAYMLPLNRDSAGNAFLRIDSSTQLYLALAVALASGKLLNVLPWGDVF